MAASFQSQKHKPSLSQAQDQWTVREKLSLASSVQRSGDQNWVSVSRAIKPINETGRCGKVRPPDFFSQKNCAIHYSQMLEKVNTPKRKRTNETGAGETPGEQIMRKMTFDRIEELKKSMKNDQLTYRKLKMHIEDIRSGKLDAQLPKVWEDIQAKRRMEERKSPGPLPTSGGGDTVTTPISGPSGFSFPIISSAVTGLKHASQPTPSPHKGKQLRIPKPTPRFQKYQQQLQQRHSQGSGQHTQPAGSPAEAGEQKPGDSPRASLDSEPLKTEPMDINPREAVQTVSVDVPPSSSVDTMVAKTEPGTTSPASSVRRGSSGNTAPQVESLKTLLTQPAKEQTSLLQDSVNKGIELPPATKPQATPSPPSSTPTSQALNRPQVNDQKSFLGHRPSPEAHSVRERTISTAASVTAPTLSKLLITSSSSSPIATKTLVNSTSSNSFIEKPLPSKTLESSISISSTPDMTGLGRGAIVVGGKGDGGCGVVTSLSVNPKTALNTGALPSPIAMTPPPSSPPPDKKVDMITESAVKIVEPVVSNPDVKSIDDMNDNKEEPDVASGDTEDSLGSEAKIEIVDTPQPSPRVAGRTRAPKPGRPGRPRGRRSQRRSKSVTSTDNETEVEEEKEEDTKSESMEAESEKASEKDDDDDEDDMESTLSEKKDDSEEEEEQESIDDGLSESKEESYLDRASTIGSESVPASPASQISQGDMDSDSVQAQKTWKKSIMLVWRAAANHKYANVFLHAVTDDEAPGYHNIVFRPMDLTTIKKNIENGSIRTTSEFQRDMMLMFQNALMYNSADHDVYRMAEEMRDDVMEQIQSYIATQLMVQSSDRDSTKMLRGHRSDVFHFFL